MASHLGASCIEHNTWVLFWFLNFYWLKFGGNLIACHVAIHITTQLVSVSNFVTEICMGNNLQATRSTASSCQYKPSVSLWVKDSALHT